MVSHSEHRDNYFFKLMFYRSLLCLFFILGPVVNSVKPERKTSKFESDLNYKFKRITL